MTAVLDVRDLKVTYSTRRGRLQAVDGVSFAIEKGQTLGLVGESGCGKSSLGKAIMRLVTPTGGQVRVMGEDITTRSAARLRPLRRRFQMVFQDPSASLDPRQKVRDIIAEPLAFHRIGSTEDRSARVAELMAQVGLHPAMAGRLPHEFSGGQRQRISIARAIAPEPDLLVCDEPVSALDVSLQAQILNLLRDLQDRTGVACLFISHDLSVVQHLADRVAVMYLGQIVEIAGRDRFWRHAAHPYTRALIDAVPQIRPGAARSHRRLLQGDLPNPFAPPAGCHFSSRCPLATDRCLAEAPALRSVAPDHAIACHLF
ncbi:ATP-binding cassette domain-containing protein [Sinirhodobacter populi]|uniref:ATP-binding cassette domain-containing protein n=1 Tax=Paenirhodobacter populi TaxID=2306993 RepID=A0A443K4K9_9RHOB|nr:oligopeptide/dipeptide ABC transporter ATP-binding protein [Sinirhodobacter populi]RWR27696.1 ATP-binding cassette domain-containing protein [Sinirhodobacter populi]